MNRRVLHVVPNKEDKNWEVTEDHGCVELGVRKTQAEAIRLAQESIASQIVVHGKDGRIAREYTYGLDPEKSKG